MSIIKAYECRICKKLADKRIKGEFGFKGNRKEVRQHLFKIHRVRGEVMDPNSRLQLKHSRVSDETLSYAI